MLLNWGEAEDGLMMAGLLKSEDATAPNLYRKVKALTVSYVPLSLDSGPLTPDCLPDLLLLLLYSRTGPRRALSLKLSDTAPDDVAP